MQIYISVIDLCSEYVAHQANKFIITNFVLLYCFIFIVIIFTNRATMNIVSFTVQYSISYNFVICQQRPARFTR